ncbi:Uncharacterized protein HZ326_31160, partial [Fusarium oxysporum f. sp. albedinis]
IGSEYWALTESESSRGSLIDNSRPRCSTANRTKKLRGYWMMGSKFRPERSHAKVRAWFGGLPNLELDWSPGRTGLAWSDTIFFLILQQRHLQPPAEPTSLSLFYLKTLRDSRSSSDPILFPFFPSSPPLLPYRSSS